MFMVCNFCLDLVLLPSTFIHQPRKIMGQNEYINDLTQTSFNIQPILLISHNFLFSRRINGFDEYTCNLLFSMSNLYFIKQRKICLVIIIIKKMKSL